MMENGKIQKKRFKLVPGLKDRIDHLLTQFNSSKQVLHRLEYEGFKLVDFKTDILSYCAITRRNINNKWIVEKKFDERTEAENYLKSQSIWSFVSHSRSRFGMTYYYRCNMVPVKGPQCEARKYFTFNKYTNKITLYKRSLAHTHAAILPKGQSTELLQQLNKNLRDTLIEQGFRVLHCVSLRDCLAKTNDYDKSFSKNLPMLQQKKKKKRKKNFRPDWIMEQEFSDEHTAKAHLAKDNQWKIDRRKSNKVIGGHKIHYRCNMVLKNGPRCAASKCLMFYDVSDKIVLFKNNRNHTHDSNMPLQLSTSEVSPKRRKRKYRKRKKVLTLQSNEKQVQSPQYKHNNLQETNKNVNIELNCSDSFINHDINESEIKFEVHDPIEHVIDYVDDSQNKTVNERTKSKQNIKSIAELNNSTNIDKHDWKLVEKIPLKSMVSSYINKQMTWRYNRSEGSSSVYYCCTTKNCQAQLQLKYENENYQMCPKYKVLVFNSGEHNHTITSGSELQADNYLNSNIIVKEEVIISDTAAVVSNQNYSDAFASNVYYEYIDEEQSSITQKWNFEKKFANMDAANQFLAASNDLWKLQKNSLPKLLYCCKYPCDPPCSAQICLIIDTNCNEVLYFSGNPHVHSAKNDPEPSSTLIDEIIVDDSDDIKEPKVEKSIAPNPSTNSDSKNDALSLNEFKFMEECTNLTEAMNKMRQETDCWVLMHVENGNHQYFWCNLYNNGDRCPRRVLFVGRNDSEKVFYYTSGLHNHGLVNLNQSETFEIIELPATTPVKSTDCIDEIIISDDSDKDSLNGDAVDSNREKWTLELTFENYNTAKNYITKDLKLLSFKTNISKRGIKEYYNCNMIINDGHYCPSSKYLQYKDVNNDVLMYERNIRHAKNCTGAISSSVNGDNGVGLSQLPILNTSESLDNISSKKEQVTTSWFSKEVWTLEKLFDNYQNAFKYLNEPQIWTLKAKSKTSEGVTELYRCCLTTLESNPCSAAKYIESKHSTNIVYLYKSDQSHTHNEFSTKARVQKMYANLDSGTKAEIKTWLLAGVKPKYILGKLNLTNFDNSFKTCLYRFLAKIRLNLYMEINNMNTILDDQFKVKYIEQWIKGITAFPKGEDTYYCTCYNADYLNNKFRCFLTTRRLLKNTLNANILHINSTDSMLWHNNQITIIGTTDLVHQFHCYGVAISSQTNQIDYEFMFKALQKGVQECLNQKFKPKCLITDDNENVRNAFIKMFGDTIPIGTCSQVALTKINSKLDEYVESELSKKQILNDIQNIQKLPSKLKFVKAVDLFFQKWRCLDIVQVNNFLNYFKSMWIDRNRNWFQGFRPFTPHTNNAIHSEYENLKKKFFCKQIAPIKSFSYFIKSELEQLSRSYGTGSKSFVHQTIVPTSVYEKAVAWNNLEEQIEIVKSATKTCFYISSESTGKGICKKKLLKYQMCNHQSLEELFEIQASFCCVELLTDTEVLTCNCSNYMENYVCEHSIGMAWLLNLIKFNPSIE